MKIKTVWHWKEIGKAVVILASVAVGWGFVDAALSLTYEMSMLMGLMVGTVAGALCATTMDLWHFTTTGEDHE